jgi:hypothetical protein
MSLIVTAGSWVLNEVVTPRTNAEHERLMKQFDPNEAASSDRPFVQTITKEGITKTVIYCPPKGYNDKTHTLHNVVVVQYQDNLPQVLIYGKDADLQRVNESASQSQWSFKNGYYQPGY